MMDTIYTQAHLTIIAPEGDAYQGLPGVNGLCRYKPTILSLGNVKMRIIKDPITELTLGNWVWTKRAWTYQEGCLSRRKIFFTSFGVVFWCGPMYRLEGIQYPSISSDERNDYFRLILRRAVPHVRTTPDVSINYMVEAIAHYSEREMTYEHDALNAFLGVLNAFNITHYWGVPIVPHIITQLPGMMLFWVTKKAGNERCDFPTWSWTRWNTGISFSRPASDLRLPTTSSIKTIEIQLQDMRWCNVLGDCPYRGNLGRIGCGKKLRITGYTVEFQCDPLDDTRYFFVSSSKAREYPFVINFDDKDDLTRKDLAEATMFELDQIRVKDKFSLEDRSVFWMWARYLVLMKQGEEYRRIGLAQPGFWEPPGCDSTAEGEQQDCLDDPIELKGRRLQTIYLV